MANPTAWKSSLSQRKMLLPDGILKVYVSSSLVWWVFPCNISTPLAHFEVSTPLWGLLRRKALTWSEQRKLPQMSHSWLWLPLHQVKSHTFSSFASSSPIFSHHSCFSALSSTFWIPLYPSPTFPCPSPFKALHMPPCLWLFHISLPIQILLLLKLSSKIFLT